MRSTDQNHSNFQPVPDQQRFDFNPIEATPEESERLRRIALQWAPKEAEEDFKQLPGESLPESMEALERTGGVRAPVPVAWQLFQRFRQLLPTENQHQR